MALSESGVKLHKDKLSRQLNIFKTLEKDLPFKKADFLGDEVHFQNASDTPIQRWFPYREGYSQKLVDFFIESLRINGLVFDPFAGSGTTLLSARNKKIDSIGIDVNPISVLVGQVENENYLQSDIVELRVIVDSLSELDPPKKSFKTKFPLKDKVFNSEILDSIIFLRETIKKIENPRLYKLVFSQWISIIESVSNIKKEGNGIKYKNRKRTKTGYINIPKEEWENSNFPRDKHSFVLKKLIEKLKIVLIDLEENYGNTEYLPLIVEHNCLKFPDVFQDQIEFTFFSPPYCNCFDYFEIHKVELWLAEFVNSRDEIKKLKSSGFRSNTSSISLKEINFKFEPLEELIQLLDFDKLWSKKIPDVIRGYFDDFYDLLHKLYSQTKINGYVGIVVGNSAYQGVIIPTDIIISRIGELIGFKVQDVYVTRHLTTSSQQKKMLEPLKGYLRESVIILKKVK